MLGASTLLLLRRNLFKADTHQCFQGKTDASTADTYTHNYPLNTQKQ